VVEALLEHSKTGFSRYLDMAGKTTTSGVECAEIMSEYWKLARFKTITTTQAGVRVTRPDFWVVRVSLLGIDEQMLNSLIHWLHNSKYQRVKGHAAASAIDAKRRYIASGAMSQEKKFINVAAGAASETELRSIEAELKMRGYRAAIVPGPLLLATTGGGRPRMKIMPLTTSSAGNPVKEILTRAHAEANRDPADPDPDLDLDARREPRWASHSLRRCADTVARRYREVTGITEAQIDIFFGWHEKILLKAMQVHYAAMSIRERMRTAMVTGML
jgi:hypothetical protein